MMTIKIDPSGTALCAAASLHREALPVSLISRLGPAYTQVFYQFAKGSESETIFVMCDANGNVLGGAVLSLRPSTLSKRLLFKTPLLLHLAFRPLIGVEAAIHMISRVPLLAHLANLPEVIALYSAEPHRNRGIGKALCVAIEDYLSARGKRRYTIRTENDSENRAISFYQRQGFKTAQRFRAHGHSFVMMLKNIA